MIKRSNDRLESLVIVEETENPDKLVVGRERIEKRKPAPLALAVDSVGLRRRQKCQRMVEDSFKTMHLLDFPAIAPVMDDDADRFAPLRSTQMPGDPQRQAFVARAFGIDVAGSTPFAGQDRPDEIERRQRRGPPY